MTALLEVRDVGIEFGGVRALQDVSFDVDRGTICGLIGPNGAGKTTLFNAISRVYSVSRGSIHFAGHDITALPADRIIGARHCPHAAECRPVRRDCRWSTTSCSVRITGCKPGFINAIFGRGAVTDIAAVEDEARGPARAISDSAGWPIIWPAVCPSAP